MNERILSLSEFLKINLSVLLSKDCNQPRARTRTLTFSLERMEKTYRNEEKHRRKRKQKNKQNSRSVILPFILRRSSSFPSLTFVIVSVKKKK